MAIIALGKDPTLDGIVESDVKGKERRRSTTLKEIEHDYARRITQMFQQNACCFNIIRTPLNSYVIDVNG